MDGKMIKTRADVYYTQNYIRWSRKKIAQCQAIRALKERVRLISDLHVVHRINTHVLIFYGRCIT